MSAVLAGIGIAVIVGGLVLFTLATIGMCARKNDDPE